MYQRWRALLFLHFPCDPRKVQSLLPPGLTVDTFPDEYGDERAWVGLVPFRMEGVRPRCLPGLPGLSAFPETNVRTYVHHEGKAPGVWFFSLDADQRIACWAARKFFGLPYHDAHMTVIQDGDEYRYRSRRKGQEADVDINAAFGEPLIDPAPGSVGFFLVERYLLYAYRNNQLFTGQVHHLPYPLRSATVSRCSETLVRSNGLEAAPYVHKVASYGVDVEVFPLRPID